VWPLSLAAFLKRARLDESAHHADDKKQRIGGKQALTVSEPSSSLPSAVLEKTVSEASSGSTMSLALTGYRRKIADALRLVNDIRR